MPTDSTPATPGTPNLNPRQRNTDATEWVTVSEERPAEIKLDFTYIGEDFTGVYLGSREQPGQFRSYLQYRFKGSDDEVYFIAGASLTEPMRRVRPGNLTRLTFVDEQDTGRDSMMKIIRVEVAKRPAQRAAQ